MVETTGRGRHLGVYPERTWFWNYPVDWENCQSYVVFVKEVRVPRSNQGKLRRGNPLLTHNRGTCKVVQVIIGKPLEAAFEITLRRRL